MVIDPAGDPGQDVPAVGATNWQGGLAATRHLLELGHRRIGVISGPARMMCSRARVDGYRAALETAGLAVRPGPGRARATSTTRPATRAGLELLRLPDRPTAIFAGNDLQALGLYEAARELGLRIPEDLSVVGFDDLPLARWVGPPLTTVRQPLTEMAEVGRPAGARPGPRQSGRAPCGWTWPPAWWSAAARCGPGASAAEVWARWMLERAAVQRIRPGRAGMTGRRRWFYGHRWHSGTDPDFRSVASAQSVAVGPSARRPLRRGLVVRACAFGAAAGTCCTAARRPATAPLWKDTERSTAHASEDAACSAA